MLPAEDEFARALPRLVADAADRWGLDLGPSLDSGETGSYVARARAADGRRAIVKIGRPHEEAAHEAEGLRAWGGEGAVLLLAAHRDERVDVLLLEACEPGAPLSSVTSEDARDSVVADLLRRLWIEPPAGHPFRPLSHMCGRWADRFEERANEWTLDPGIARAGSELFRRLPERATRSVLLSTDLHAGNILAARREPWLMIDPKPYVGDPAYDVLQYMLNSPGRLAADPAGFAARLAEPLELDSVHLRRWLFARCVVESLDWPGLDRVARALAPGAG